MRYASKRQARPVTGIVPLMDIRQAPRPPSPVSLRFLMSL